MAKLTKQIRQNRHIPANSSGKALSAFHRPVGEKALPQSHVNPKFSLHDSSSSLSSSNSSSESDADPPTRHFSGKSHVPFHARSGSELSLTGVSDQEALYGKFPKRISGKSVGGGKSRSHLAKLVKLAKLNKLFATKRTPRKTVAWKLPGLGDDLNEMSDLDVPAGLDSDLQSDSDDDSDDDSRGASVMDDFFNQGGFRGLDHSKDGNKDQHHDSDDDDDDDEDDGDGDDNSQSLGQSLGLDDTESDSDIDYVRLQEKRKANSVATPSKSSAVPLGLADLMAISVNPKPQANSLKIAPSQQQTTALLAASPPPDDVMGFEFDLVSNLFPLQEEDLGEEVLVSPTLNDKDMPLPLNFEMPLMLVPKFNEDEFNSDDDYEFDDNELLATLQADTGAGEFLDSPRARANSLDSAGGDDDENDPFLQEEEAFLVNEFENNGFDDDDLNLGLSNDSRKESLMLSLKHINGNATKVLQYESSADSEGSNPTRSAPGNDLDDDDDEYDEQDFDDFIGYPNTMFDDGHEEDEYSWGEDNDSPRVSLFLRNSKPLQRKRRYARPSKSLESDEDDELYLWSYFLSSGKDSSSDEQAVKLDENMHVPDGTETVDLFHENSKRTGPPAQPGLPKRKHVYASNYQHVLALRNNNENDQDGHDDGYGSGESTDVDEALASKSSRTRLGSKVAKEVLSSKTADYRPPLMGSWTTATTKPFGIIDGLSTRTLNSSNTQSSAPGLVLRTKGRKPAPSNPPTVAQVSTTHEDAAIGLDELLNVSELDADDETDAKIWRDFNNQKKQVPLGAFRNKSLQQHPMLAANGTPSPYSHSGKPHGEFNQRRFSLSPHHNHVPSRRRLSLASKSGPIKKPGGPGRRNSSHANAPISWTIDNDRLGLITGVPSKLKRRRASIVEATAEGLRPTKLGLFSEYALANVEELLGDDTEIQALLKGI